MMNMNDMVSKIIRKGLPFIVAMLAFTACDKPFKLDLPLAVDSREYHLSKKEGVARVFFYTTKSWNITLEPADCSWASINRTSGSGEDDVEEILFTYQQNAEIDREVTIVINAGELQEKITMFQTGVAKEWWDGSLSVDDLVVKPVN
jgi:hypothetical protein